MRYSGTTHLYLYLLDKQLRESVWVYVSVLAPEQLFDTCDWFESFVATKHLSYKYVSCHSCVSSINRTKVKPQCGATRALSCSGVIKAITFSLSPPQIDLVPLTLLQSAVSFTRISNAFATVLQFCEFLVYIDLPQLQICYINIDSISCTTIEVFKYYYIVVIK